MQLSAILPFENVKCWVGMNRNDSAVFVLAERANSGTF